MKRIISIALIVALCLSIAPAFADSNVNVNINTGDNSTVQDINITNVDGCNNDVNVDTGGPSSNCNPGKPGKPGRTTVVIIDGVPGCVEPPDYCGTDPRFTNLQGAIRNVWAYLEGRLQSIGWWYYGPHKFVWSHGTRIIYGRSGDNNHYRRRRATTFYYVDDDSIQKKAFLNAYVSGNEFIFLFSEDFVPVPNCDDINYADYYSDDVKITDSYANGYAAVDEFIRKLQALSGDEDYDCE